MNPQTTPQVDVPVKEEEKLTDEQVMEGAPVEEIVASETAPAEPEPDAPIFKWGDKEFRSQEELAAFIQDLDKKAAKNQGYEEAIAKLNAIQPAPEPKKADEPEGLVIDGKNVGEEIWANPDEALKLVKEAAIQEAKEQIRAEQVSQREVDKLWEDFYSKNEDLSDVREHVDMMLAKNQKELYAMPTTEALDKLATLTRGELKRIRDKYKETENLGDKPAQVASPTTASGPATPEPEVVKNVAFIDQVRQFQSKYFT